MSDDSKLDMQISRFSYCI